MIQWALELPHPPVVWLLEDSPAAAAAEFVAVSAAASGDLW